MNPCINIIRLLIIPCFVLLLYLSSITILSGQSDKHGEAAKWLSRAKELSSAYQMSDSIYIYYMLAKDQLEINVNDSLLFYCNNGLIEWHRRYGDNKTVLKLLNENKSLVHNDLSQAILFLSYCTYYDLPGNYDSDSLRHYAGEALSVSTASNDTVHSIIAKQFLVIEYLKDPDMLSKVPEICHEILSMRDHSPVTQSLAVQTDMDLADYYIQTDQAKRALEILSKYTINTEDYDVGFRIWVTEYVKKAYVQLGDYYKAYEASDDLTKLAHEQADKEREQSLREMEVVYQLQRTEQELISSQQLAKANESRINTQRYFIYSLIAGALSIIGLIYLAWYNQRKKAQANMIIAEAQKEIVQMKSAFFDNIAHEIRTPLTIIKGMSNRIKNMSKERDLISRNADHILSLVDQVLDLSKSDQGLLKLYAKQVNIIPLIKTEVDDHQPLAREKSINLSLNTDIERYEMMIDDGRLRQICTNLLSNAIKYTPDRGSVTMAVDEVEDGIEIRCKDSGVGISPSEAKQIFDRFYRADRQYASGAGIGLSLVKELVDLMGGNIEVSSQVDIGTQFTVFLPNR